MSQKEKVIKYIATALAILLAIGIVIFVVAGIATLFGMTAFFDNKTGNSYKTETDFDMDNDFFEDDDFDGNDNWDDNDNWDNDDNRDDDDNWNTDYGNHKGNHNNYSENHSNHHNGQNSNTFDNSNIDSAKENAYDTTNISSFFDTVSDIEIDALIYEVHILQGTSDKVQVECNNVIEDYIVEQDADGSLHLYGKGIAFGENALSRFADFLDGKHTLNSNWEGSITIYLPENCSLKDCKIFGGTGDIHLSDIVCENLDLDLGTGALTIDHLECNKLDLDSGTGNVTLNHIVSYETDIDCGTGFVSIFGKLLGETDISCGVGKLDIALADSEADYKIEIEKGLGHLTVNGNTCKEYHSNPSGASNHLDIEGGMGDINIDFGHSF